MDSNKRQRVEVQPAVEQVALPTPATPARKVRRRMPSRPREATFHINRKLEITRSLLLKLFDLKPSTTLTNTDPVFPGPGPQGTNFARSPSRTSLFAKSPTCLSLANVRQKTSNREFLPKSLLGKS